MRRTMLCAAVALALAGSPGQLAAQEPGARTGAAELRPSDALRITVWGQPALTGQFQLGTDGTILHPLYQTVTATGIPLTEVKQRLRTFLQRYETEPQFLVEPLFHVYLGGAVRQPNLYLVPADGSVAAAVAQAGGATEVGRLDRVVVIRGSEQIEVDLTEAQGAQLRVQSGDQIVVSRRHNIMQEYVGPMASLLAALGSIFVLVFGAPGGTGSP